ncbi:MAG: Fic family protein [Actinobacteria bacterium]|nr:Fic family protein [Actinomycetota bacterium]
MSDDPYIDALTGYLRHLLDVDSQEDFERAEANITAARALELQYRPVVGAYDVRHLQAVHRHLFAGIYDWAGEFRTVDIARTLKFGSWRHVASYLDEQFAQLRAEDHLVGLQRDTFVDRVTYYFGEVNAAHPFREGNGRTQRAFFSQLAVDAGWRLRWAAVTPHENAVASEASLRGHPDPLRELFMRITHPATDDRDGGGHER